MISHPNYSLNDRCVDQRNSRNAKYIMYRAVYLELHDCVVVVVVSLPTHTHTHIYSQPGIYSIIFHMSAHVHLESCIIYSSAAIKGEHIEATLKLCIFLS